MSNAVALPGSRGYPLWWHRDDVCPALAEFARGLVEQCSTAFPGDREDDQRRLTETLLPMVTGTRVDANAVERRAYSAVDWSLRTVAPLVLGRIGLHETATRMRSLRPIVDRMSATAAHAIGDDVARAIHDAPDARAMCSYDRQHAEELMRSMGAYSLLRGYYAGACWEASRSAAGCAGNEREARDAFWALAFDQVSALVSR